MTPHFDLLEAWGTLPDATFSRSWRMRPDEAVVWIGTLPPEARYFSYRSYAVGRMEAGVPQPILASLGPSLNQLVVAFDRGIAPEAIWGAPVVVLTTADAEVEQATIDRLVAAGFARDTIHLDRIPPAVARLGITDDADAIGAIVRIAVDIDPVAGTSWRDDPGATVLRLTPPGEEVATAPHPIPELPARGSGLDESAWAEALDALDTAIAASLGEAPYFGVLATPTWQETLECIDTLPTCAGDIRDRYAAISPYLTLGQDDYAVVFGVNHEHTGKASYASFAVVTEVHEIGAAVLESTDMVGTARYWLPDHPLAHDLYAMVVARDCAGRPEPCLAVPTGCPGPEVDERVRVTIRAYLEPATGAAPLPEEMLLDRVVKVWPESATPTP